MKQIRAKAGVILTILVVGLFIWYAWSHPSLIDDLKKASLPIILLLLLLYGLTLLTIALILHYSINWCGHNIKTKENVLLTAYSTLINFFGPLQSGPGFRAIYLKAKHRINFRNFILISLFYYLMLSWYSAIILFMGDKRWLLVAIIIFGGILLFVLAVLLSPRFARLHELIYKNPKQLVNISVMTLVQILILTLIYYFELRTMNHRTSFGQAMSYTGAANFSLFVSLTPGAIGFREAFVLFTRRISHLSSSTIIAASVLDRAVYFIYLGLLFILAITVHLGDRFRVSQADQQSG